VDDRNEFLARLRVQVQRETNHCVIEVSGAVAITNSIAYLSELLDTVSTGSDASQSDETVFSYLI
jgi:nicotinate-nucleotide pyrophosphorylase